MRYLLLTALFFAFGFHAEGQALRQTKGDFEDKFRQLDEDLPTPNESRLASGAPGPDYWQQEVDYTIDITLDEAGRRMTGSETITYTNNSPHTLTYLWLQLDQNRFAADSTDNLTRTSILDQCGTMAMTGNGCIADYNVRRARAIEELEGGYQISNVRSLGRGAGPLPYIITDTNMRIDLPRALAPGQSIRFALDFAFNMYETKVIGGRAGYECFKNDDETDNHCIFLAAQWFPRLHSYSDYEGWHNKAFLGSGEFTLEFGDYNVEITVPADHIVSSTGVLQNESAVLTATQRARLREARSSGEPLFVVTPEEARASEANIADGTKTWVFEADNVRDFAWASSRKFIWDAMNVTQEQANGADVLAMSFYPNEAEPLWSAYSTKSIAHTIDVYSRYSFAYPYPTAQSVNGPVGGMEYPMITFNGPRPVKDDDGNLTYSARTKHGLISVIIHEIGHIYFPMIVNSDERQWTWMDEGVNTFLQFVAEKEWDENYPSRRGEPRNMTEYMMSEMQVPIMTQSDSILQFGNNAYGKPATALNVLRETVLGRELFDKAFRDYAERWMFKRPTPSDLFRTMEESSGVDLDWFWRGWFYSTDHVDISIDSIVQGTLNTGNPEIENPRRRQEHAEEPLSLTIERNAGIETAIERDPALRDFYNEYDEFSFGQNDIDAYETANKALEDWQVEARDSTDNFYYVTFTNHGGLVMPLPLKITYASGETEMLRIPAEIWRRNAKTVTKLIVTEREIVSIELDPRWEIADVNRNNNTFPPQIQPNRLERFMNTPIDNLMDRLDFKVEPTGLQAIAQAKDDADEASTNSGGDE